ncbi:capsid protein [Bat circovirus]|nr:capsid protein [Bat circovirus]
MTAHAQGGGARHASAMFLFLEMARWHTRRWRRAPLHAVARSHRRRRHAMGGRRRRHRRRSTYKFFHVRLTRYYTVLWPRATTPSDDTETTYGWNLDHVNFKLSDFLPMDSTGRSSLPAFKDYNITKAIVRVKPINVPVSMRVEQYGNRATDFDGTDVGIGTVHTSGDPKPSPNNETGPKTSDPLRNRTSRKSWNVRTGFTRILRPTVVAQTANCCGIGPGSNFITRGLRHAWLRLDSNGVKTPWNGLSISLREGDQSLLTQYTITIYVKFREFDLDFNPHA